MIFNSSGHDKVNDPGAVANGHKEADLTIEFRNLINAHLKTLGATFTGDKDNEKLAAYLKRIRTGTGSVVYETHFNAATPSATGVEMIIPDRHTTYEYDMAKEMAHAVHYITGLPLRGKNGVKTESETHRGKLAIMRPEGINVLSEMCFITNRRDLDRYFAAKECLAVRFAEILVKYDKMLS